MKGNILEQSIPRGYRRAPRNKTEDYTDSDGVEWDVIKINNIYYQKNKSNSGNTQTTSQPNWSKCIKNQEFYKDGNYNPSSGKFEFKEPITATGVVTNPLTTVKRDLNTFDENGVWNFTDSDGEILETGKWKCLPIIGTVINNPTDNFHISIKGVWYLKRSIPIDFNSIKEVNGVIVGKYDGKDAIWNDASEEWEVTNTGNQNTGSQNNSSTNNQNTNTTNNTTTGCRKLTTKKDKDFFNYKKPNDTKYLYGKQGGEWFALNTKTNNQFNVSKCYPNAISKLNDSVIKISTISNDNSYINSGEKSTSGIKVRPKQTPLSNSKIEGEDSLTNSGKYVDLKIGI